jgi:hypothetical protein
MSTFDPSQPAMVHDCFTDRLMRWDPSSCRDYRSNAARAAGGTVLWEGRLFDGWSPLM